MLYCKLGIYYFQETFIIQGCGNILYKITSECEPIYLYIGLVLE